ncbi:M16 family metallopeptidase [Bacteroidota bacterium]
MKNIKPFIIIFTIAIFSNSLFAQIDSCVQPKSDPTPEYKIGEYKFFTLDNGLKVAVVENHKTPSILYQLTIDVDPIMENEAKGFVSMAGDLMKSGTTNKSKVEIDKAIDFIGACLNTYENGIYGLTPTKHKDEFLGIFSDILLNPSFPEEEVEKSKKQAFSGLISSKTNPGFIASRVGQKLRNPNHPYGEITTKESIEKITRDHLMKYYNTFYKPNVSYLVIVGDITLKQAKIDIEKYLSEWEKAEVSKHEYQFPNKNIGARVALVHLDSAVQSYINITYPVNIKVGDKLSVQASLANDMLGSNFSSARLLANLHEDNGYAYGAYSNLSKDPLVGSFRAFTQVKTNVTDDAINQFIKEMNKMKNELVDDETLNLFKTFRADSFAHSLEDPQTVTRLAFNSLKYDLPDDYYQTYFDKIDAVTKEQIQSVSKIYIDPDQAIIVIVGDKNKLLESLKKYSSTGKVEIYDIYGNPVKEETKKAIPEGVTAETVLESYFEALGGKENLEKIQDIITVATANNNGMEIKQKTYKKAPNKYSRIVSMNGNIMNKLAFNGEKGIMKNFHGEQEVVGEDLENLKVTATVYAELNYKEFSIDITLEAIEKISESDAYKLKLVNPAGQTTYDYFDVKSGLKVQSKEIYVAPQGEFTQMQNYSDYQEVDGVKFPFLIKSSGVQNMELKVDSILINTELSDSLFQ